MNLPIEELMVDLKYAMPHINVNWEASEAAQKKQPFPKSHSQGSFFSIALSLTAYIGFYNYPLPDELGSLEMVYGQPSRGVQGKSYWVQPCPTQDTIAVQCGYAAVVLSGGGPDPMSSQLYRSAAMNIFDQLSECDRQKLLIVTVPLSKSGTARGEWVLKMSATIAYLLQPGTDPEKQADAICLKLFCGKASISAYGLNLMVHRSVKDAMELRPGCPSLLPTPVTIITGALPTAGMEELITALHDTGGVVSTGPNLLVQVRSVGKSGLLARNLLLVGDHTVGHITKTDQRLAGISSSGDSGYTIAVTTHTELNAQGILRDQHNATHSTKKSGAQPQSKKQANQKQHLQPQA